MSCIYGYKLLSYAKSMHTLIIIRAYATYIIHTNYELVLYVVLVFISASQSPQSIQYPTTPDKWLAAGHYLILSPMAYRESRRISFLASFNSASPMCFTLQCPFTIFLSQCLACSSFLVSPYSPYAYQIPRP